MTTTQSRPSLARKVTPKSEAKRASALEEGVRITIEGETFEVRVGDISAHDERALRREWGGSFQDLSDELGGKPGIDSISAFVWFARRMRGDDVEFDDVNYTYAAILADDFAVALAGDEEVSDNPEA
jgi:hypothetical protein